MAFETNMSDLLTSIKQVLLDGRESTGVTHLKRGVLPPLPTFPTIALLPDIENILEYRNNGKYIIERNVSVEVYAKAYDVKDAKKKVLDVITEIIGLARIQNNLGANRWSTSCFDCTWSEEVYETPFEYSGQIVQIGILPMSFISNESMPTNRLKYGSVTETGLSDTIDEIYDTLVGYVNQTDVTYDLSNVRNVYKKEIPPVPDFPSITIVSRGTDRDRARTGEDVAKFNIELGVWTKLLDKEYALNQSLALVETIKDIVQYNELWGGKVINSYIDDIQYERADTEKLGMVYRSLVNLIIEGMEVTNK